MMKENRGETLRIAERWEVRAARAEMGAVETMGVVGMVGGASRTGKDGSGERGGNGERCEPHGQGWERRE